MHKMILGLDENNMPVFSPYQPWSEARRRKHRLALELQRKRKLEEKLAEINQLIDSL